MSRRRKERKRRTRRAGHWGWGGEASPFGRRDPHHPYGRRWYDEQRTEGEALRMAAYGFLGGFVLGVAVWSHQLHQNRSGLFSRWPLRRLAALGYLGGHPSVDTARLLRDYIAWERRPALRRRGEQVLRHVEQSLE